MTRRALIPAFSPSDQFFGALAFFATLDDGTHRVMFSSAGVETTIANSSDSFAFFNGTTVNASGTVAFRAALDAGGAGIYTGTGGTPLPIAETGPSYSILDSVPGINDAGAFAFRATLADGTRGLFVSLGGGITPIVNSTGPLDIFTATPAINTAGIVAFAATLDGGGFGLYTGNGGSLTTIADTTGIYSAWTDPSMNDAGTIVSVGFLDAGGSRIVRIEAGNFTTVADSTSTVFSSFGGPSINAMGGLAFTAFLDNSGGMGLYTGGDPVNDLVLRNGDPLFGSTVDGLLLSQKALNDAGQIAFSYTLVDGGRGIVIATPGLAVSQPPTVALTGKSKIPTTKPSILLKGTATSASTLDRVEVSYRLKGKKGARTFTRTARLVGGMWTFKLRVKQPRSTLSIRAINTDGLVSNVVRATVIRK